MKHLARTSVALLVCLLMAGCPSMNPADQAGNPDGTGSTGGNNNGTNGGTNGGNTGGTIGNGGAVTDAALSFQGTFGGTATTESSTNNGSQSARSKPRATAQSSNATGWFEDLEGNRLLDANGQPYATFTLGADGGFSFANLPVGVDIAVRIDLDGDGEADLGTIINIPQDANGHTGSLDKIWIDPLSTLILAKLKAILEENNVNPEDLPISPSALVERIRNAFEHLFEDAGIDQDITLEDLQNLTDEQLAALFDNLVPDGAQIGMRMCVGNLRLAAAEDVVAVVKAVAEILLQGGFAIADEPQGIDLSFLGTLPDVEAYTFQQWHQAQQGDQQGGQDFPQPVIYVSKLGEADRNHPYEGAAEGPGRRHAPIFSEHLLKRMADLYLSKKTISLGELHRIVVDAQHGLAARFVYHKFNGPDMPPTDVFESLDGYGIERDIFAFSESLRELGVMNPDPGLFEQRRAQLRAAIQEFLGGTAEPSFERLFDGILMDRVPSADEFAQLVRDARAHAPFSRSGPANFFVVATADPFRNPDTAAAVTVDATLDDDGLLETVTYNAAGNGAFYLGFGPRLEDGGQVVHFIHRETGRFLHDHYGRPQALDLRDAIFAAVNGETFFEAFSETGAHYPGAPALEVANPNYNPNEPANAETNPPTKQAFVLLTRPGPDGVPARVHWAEGADGPAATYAEDGEYYLLFTERTPEEGLFALIHGETGEILTETPGDKETRILVNAADVQGADLAPETFTHVFGMEVPNPGYNPDGDPYYDDINENGAQDADEPSFSFRPFLHNPSDWRSTRVDYYYRRADNNEFVAAHDINFRAETPATLDGVELVARNFQPRLNVFRFGRPAVTVNLLAAFSPPEFFDGTHALDDATRVNPFTALALLNLVFDSVHNVEAYIDLDGPHGPWSPRTELLNADVWTPPLGDPLLLVIEGFEHFSH